jgi:hypothetical protein
MATGTILGKVGFFSNILGRAFALRTVVAPCIEVGSTTVIPLAKVLMVKGPEGVLVRSWPAAVLVSANGRVSRIRITNLTRVAQAVVSITTMLWICFLVIRASNRKE